MSLLILLQFMTKMKLVLLFRWTSWWARHVIFSFSDEIKTTLALRSNLITGSSIHEITHNPDVISTVTKCGHLDTDICWWRCKWPEYRMNCGRCYHAYCWELPIQCGVALVGFLFSYIIMFKLLAHSLLAKEEP